MPNVSDRKLKLLYLLQMLWEGTDSQHALTLPQMLEGLEGPWNSGGAEKPLR
mgnify:CR=1 FL=1